MRLLTTNATDYALHLETCPADVGISLCWKFVEKTSKCKILGSRHLERAWASWPRRCAGLGSRPNNRLLTWFSCKATIRNPTPATIEVAVCVIFQTAGDRTMSWLSRNGKRKLNVLRIVCKYTHKPVQTLAKYSMPERKCPQDTRFAQPKYRAVQNHSIS